MRKILLFFFLLTSFIAASQITLGGTSTTVGVAPVSTYYGYSYVQQIFTKNEINANAAGNITGLQFYLNPASNITNSSNWVIYLGTTTKSSFNSDSDWIPVAQMTQVFSGSVSNLNGVVTVVFPIPFLYNNTENLVVAAKENSAGYDDNGFDDAFYGYNSTPNTVLYFRSDNINPSILLPPSGNLNNQKSVITLAGLNPNLSIPCPDINYPANNSLYTPLSPTLQWNAVTGATNYKVSMGTTLGGFDVINQQAVTATSFTVPQSLVSNTDYYLKITAVNALGESQNCGSTTFKTTPGQPVNDECINAISLTVNSNAVCTSQTQGYTLGATQSAVTPGTCFGNPDDDVWFKFVATATSHKISLNKVQSIGANYNDDIYFQIFGGSCGNLTSILCSDPVSSLVTGLTVGATYYVRVYSYDGFGSNQSFTICVGSIPPTPANDTCAGALAVSTFPYSYTQSDALGATNNSGFLTACLDGMNDGTWFSFTGNGGNVDISVSMPSGSSFDPQIGVFSGNCNVPTCVDTEDSGGDGETEMVSVPTVLGSTYFVNVGHYSQASDEMEDTFSINISSSFLSTAVVKLNDKVKVYPNPFSEIIYLSNFDEVRSLSVIDLSGRIVKTIQSPESSIYLNDLNSGLYILNLLMKDGRKQSLKIIKK